jgi:processive 1,2-diacylglycerol beta-glucosyltransferase
MFSRGYKVPISQRPLVLLLSATAGFGHVKAGRNLEVSLRGIRPDIELRHENIFDFCGPTQRLIMERGWEAVSRFRPVHSLYAGLHKSAISSSKFASIFALVHSTAARRLERLYSAFPLISVIALHPGATAACVQWKRRRHFHLFSVATDLVVHSMQAYKEVDTIYADPKAILMSTRVLRARDEGRIEFLGLPVEHLHFNRGNTPFQGQHTILISFGATGILGDSSLDWIFHAARENPECRFEFICGSNRSLYRHVARQAIAERLQERVFVHAFVDDMPRRIHEAHVLMGKPGGISAGEAFAQNKPFVIVDMLPGHERYNFESLAKNGLGFRPRSAADLVKVIKMILTRSGQATISRLATKDPAGIDAIARSIGRILPVSSDHDMQSTSQYGLDGPCI